MSLASSRGEQMSAWHPLDQQLKTDYFNLQGKIVPARGPTNFGMIAFLEPAMLQVVRKMLTSRRLGPDLRIRRQDVCRDGQGGEEHHLAPVQGSGEAEGVVRDPAVANGTFSPPATNSKLFIRPPLAVAQTRVAKPSALLSVPLSPVLAPPFPPNPHPNPHPFRIPLHLLNPITRQLHHKLLLEPLPRLLQNHLHNLHIHILLQFPIIVPAHFQTIVKGFSRGAEHDDEVDPRGGENVAGVVVEDVAAGEEEGFDYVEELECKLC